MARVNYHFLVNALPEPGAQATENVADVRALIEANLDSEGLAAFRFLLYRNDNKNLLKLLRKRDGILPAPTAAHFYQPAVLTFEDLEDMLIGAYGGSAEIPVYMQQFLDEEKRAGWQVRERENRLLELYYEAGTTFSQEYIRGMFLFKRDLKNIMLAMNARREKFKITRITVGNYDLPAALAGATQTDFGLSGSYEYIPVLHSLLESGDLLGLERRIDELLLAHCADIAGEDLFCLNHVLHYFLGLSLRYRWSLLGPDKGARALDVLIEDAVRSAGKPLEGAYA